MLVFMCGPISCIHTFFVLCSVWETDSLEVWGKGSNLLWKRIYSSAFHFVRILRSWKDPGDVFQLLVMLPVLFAACPQQQIISLCAGASSSPPPYPVPKHPQQGHSLTLAFHLPILKLNLGGLCFLIWTPLPVLRFSTHHCGCVGLYASFSAHHHCYHNRVNRDILPAVWTLLSG